MGTTSRRGFLKRVGATVSALGITASAGLIEELVEAPNLCQQAGPGLSTGQAARYDQGKPRRMMTLRALEIIVAEQLSQWVAERQYFTAYDVTQALRAAHPDINILHQHVRAIVHRRMLPPLATQFYDQEQVHYPTGSACRYRPA